MRNHHLPPLPIRPNIIELPLDFHANVRIYRLPGVSIYRHRHEGWPVEELAHGNVSLWQWQWQWQGGQAVSPVGYPGRWWCGRRWVEVGGSFVEERGD